MRQFVAKLFPFRKSLIPVVAAALTAAGGLSWIFSCPGDYVEPGIWWKLGAAGLLYSSALSAQLLLGRRPGRFVYFAFPPLLAVAEALNFAPPDRFYASQQLGFSLLLAGWCWCLDTAVGEFAARRFRRLAALPTVGIAGALYLLPLTVLVWRLVSGRKFTADSIQAVYQTNLAEGVHYFFTDPACPLLLLLAAAAATGIVLLNRLGAPAPAPVPVSVVCAVVLLAFFPGVWTELAGLESLNRTKVLFTDSLEYFNVIERYAAGEDARKAETALHVTPGSGDDGIYVLILGESHSRLRSSAYGYERDTTPFLRRAAEAADCILLRNAYACHTQTMQVLAMLLTARNQYGESEEDSAHPSLFDAANYCSYETIFLSNQYPGGRFDSPVAALASGAKRRIWLNTMEDFLLWRARPDGALLKHLPPLLEGKRTLVVLHFMGSHGPYHQRYPEGFAAELDWHAYDKSVLYTDTLLEKLIDSFRKNPRVRAAVYVSDHSEIPGVGHAADLFEPEMAAIPMLLYLSEELRRERPELEAVLRNHAQRIFTNDLTFDLMLDLMGIRNRFSPPELRIARPEYALTPERAMTLQGRVPLASPPVVASGTAVQKRSESTPESGTRTRARPDSGTPASPARPVVSNTSAETGREARSSTSSSAPEALTTRHRRPGIQSTGTVMPGL
ncbi:phosphoethanolamine transferase [uncultured Victivallis sp.]|uniref:phosphoethanolamine transferase n=1 Tax=uncultured Victivallis sp. TaxID=354118 RepID=UPI00345C9E6D